MHFLETRPAAGEFIPYYGKYIDLVPAGNLTAILAAQRAETQRLLAPLDDARALHRYAPGKWSVKEVVGHLADAERIFAYRALRFGRGDATPLAGFDENTYVPAGGFDRRPLASILEELSAVRGGTLALFTSLDEQAWVRQGMANASPISVRALGWIIAGHELHHLAVVRERYGVG